MQFLEDAVQTVVGWMILFYVQINSKVHMERGPSFKASSKRPKKFRIEPTTPGLE